MYNMYRIKIYVQLAAFKRAGRYFGKQIMNIIPYDFSRDSLRSSIAEVGY